MSNYIYIKSSLIGKKIVGISLLIFGVSCLFSNITLTFSLGITIFFVGIILISQRGIEINLEKRKIREFVYLLSFKFGYWIDFSEPEYISVFKMKFTDRRGNKTSQILKVNLFYKKNSHITVCETGDLDHALEIATYLKAILNVDILDATENESKWI